MSVDVRQIVKPAMIRAAMLAVVMGTGAGPAGAQDGRPEERGIFVMEERPSLRFGDVLRLDPTVKFDALVWSSDLHSDRADFSFDRRRVGIEGRFLRVMAFEVERELGDLKRPWRDAFVEFRKWRAMRVRGGRFKIPFGQERLTSLANLDFVNRSLASEALTPGRDTGLEVNGRLFGRVLDYKAGVFAHDGDVARGGTDEPGGRMTAGTASVSPFARSESHALRGVEFGAGAAIGDVAEGLNGLRARTVGGYEAIPPHFVSGRRLRLGAHAGWASGPISLRGEFLEARDERRGQGLGGEDLPDVIARGGYVSGTWTVIGALRNGGSAPRRGLNAGGPGAIQIAARAEWLGFWSDGNGHEPQRNPRAANILRNDLRSISYGMNWFPVRFVKLQFNLVREELSDPQRRPDPLRPAVYSRVFRIQFAM